MKDKSATVKSVSSQEGRLLEQLRRHPQIMQRVQEILDLTQNADGPLKTADQIEELLIAQLRKLGHATMNQWASRAEERVAQELKTQDDSIRSRKKKR